MIHPRRIILPLGVYQANAWSAPIGCRKYSSGFSVLWLALSGRASLLRLATVVQSDSDICSEARGEKRQRLGGSHCSITVWGYRTDRQRCFALFRENLSTRAFLFVIGSFLTGCFSSSPWQHCACFWWPCRLHLYWPSPQFISASNLKTAVSAFTQHYTDRIEVLAFLCCCCTCLRCCGADWDGWWLFFMSAYRRGLLRLFLMILPQFVEYIVSWLV